MTIDQIAEQFCAEHRIGLKTIRCHWRGREAVRPRQHLIWLLREAGCGWECIGFFLNRNHATCIHGYRAHQKRMEAAQVDQA